MTRRRLIVAFGVVVALALASVITVFAINAGRPPAEPTTYENPLDLRMPGGEQASSCADPDVIRGQSPGDSDWYLYCTTDVMSETVLDENGELIGNVIPIFRSSDLVSWTYVGDAFDELPDWIPADGLIWAPEITYSDGKYLLYFGAPDTAIDGGTSAIGVATSSSPTGPWTDSGGQVVAPDDSGRWQFDPEVIEADGNKYIYFGSFDGGVYVRELSDDGMTSLPETETQIAIADRYEGTVILQRDGWYYFIGSATNCCNGPLTGYAMFAARSESALGPFLDANGVSILDSRVGGTPVLAQNGNAWVGTGHNTVFTDFDGQDWTIYHAIDQANPYYEFEVGYTKRPAFLDPLDWVDGWPVVRGGNGVSVDAMPGPAAQPGQKSVYRPEPETDPQPGEPIAELSDEFEGSALSERWTWVRPEEVEYSLADGSLNWTTQFADLHPPQQPLASVLTEAAPSGDYVVETKVTMTTPDDGCCHNYVQGGLIVYGDDGNYVRLTSASIWGTRQTEFGKETTDVPADYPTYGNTVVGPVGDSTWLRIVHREVDGVGHYTPFTSLDGETWTRGGTWTHDLGSEPKIGLVSLGGGGLVSVFDYVRVSTVEE